MIRTKRGLNLPISGAPEQRISEGQRTRSVAIVGCDYVGMKPTMAVVQGDAVKLGQPLFSDKKNPSVVYTSPAAGIVAAINRGHQRRLLSVVIDLDPDSSTEAQVELSRYSTEQLTSLSADIIVQDLLKSGLWTSLRTRPFSRVPDPATRPHSLFINAMDTNPLAALPYVVLESQLEEFKTGVELLSRLAEQQTFVCVDRKVDGMLAGAGFSSKVQVQEFRGPHP
ncbi:MAG: NADH:ubiquinone reductase (Na(+)-transporting) subunit A, partial [Gammaproteobacteria bacterium]|nr:NADH:ubiquinone reductase (Na(+)-transporting) subunit A [Gammaproteobacteria bacterium]